MSNAVEEGGGRIADIEVQSVCLRWTRAKYSRRQYSQIKHGVPSLQIPLWLFERKQYKQRRSGLLEIYY